MNSGFSTIPVSQFSYDNGDDYQLQLIEEYILKLKNASNRYEQILNDFEYLLDRPKNMMLRKMSPKDSFYIIS